MKSNLNKWKAVVAKLFAVAIVAVAVAMLPVAPVSAASTPSLNKSSRNILIGKNYDLDVKNQIKGATYVWTTSDSKIVTVNADGLVTAKKAGTAVVTCTVTAGEDTYTLTCKVTSVKAALVFSIKNKVTALNVGQVYDVNRTIKPSTSNDKTTWTTSDASIAKPDKNGKFTALKKGTVTITGTTTSGKTDSMTFTVVDKEGVVTTQEQLDTLVGSGAQLITLRTAEKLDLTIPAGNYSATKLVVEAPNSDVHNSGTFAQIDIKSIAENSWYEDAVGNLLNILADSSRVVVGPTAKVSIAVTAEGAKLVVENNGQVTEFVMTAPADVEISGDSAQEIPVKVTVPGVTLTTSVPLSVKAEAKMDLVLLTGAEKSTVAADTEENVPDITGDVKINVTIGEGENTTTKTVTGTTPTSSGTGTPATSPSSPSTPSTPTTPSVVTTVDLSTHTTTFTLSKPYTDLTSIVVSYQGTTYTVDGTTLSLLKGYLATTDLTKIIWANTDNFSEPYNGQTVNVDATSNPMTKIVSFTGGKLAGKSYEVTLNADDSILVKSSQSGNSFTFWKVGNYTLKISTEASGVVFTPYF